MWERRLLAGMPGEMSHEELDHMEQMKTETAAHDKVKKVESFGDDHVKLSKRHKANDGQGVIGTPVMQLEQVFHQYCYVSECRLYMVARHYICRNGSTCTFGELGCLLRFVFCFV